MLLAAARTVRLYSNPPLPFLDARTAVLVYDMLLRRSFFFFFCSTWLSRRSRHLLDRVEGLVKGYLGEMTMFLRETVKL